MHVLWPDGGERATVVQKRGAELDVVVDFDNRLALVINLKLVVLS